MPILASASVSLRTARLCAAPHGCGMGLRIRPHHGLGTLIPLALAAAACGAGDLALPSGAEGDSSARTTVAGASQVTNGQGVARVGEWVLGVELEASAEGVAGSPVGFGAVGTATGGVDRMVFVAQPPDDVDARARFRVEVALADEDRDLVPLSGIVVYLGLFKDGNDVPTNALLLGDRFRETQGGVAVFDDDLPEHGPQEPQPVLFSDQFEVD